jgi:hypothetical protein
VAVLGVLLVLAVGALVWPRGAEPSASPPTTAASRPTTTRPVRPGTSTPPSSPGPTIAPPSTVPPAGPAPTLDEVQAAVEALVPFVEQQRGFAFGAHPAVEAVDNPTLDDRIRTDFDRHQTIWQHRALLMQTLGVVDRRLDVTAVVRSLEPVGRMVWYDPQRRTVVVRAQRITPYTQEQMVAALALALDDQRFGTDRPTYDASPDELPWAFDALREGDATRVADAWVKTLAPADQAARDRAEQDAHVGADLSRLPAALREVEAFPTESGTTFATALAAGGNGPLDAAFAEPPAATTGVLHPERFLGGVPVVPVPEPKVPGDVVRTGVFGELMTVATLADTLTPADAAKAAAGWAGDNYVVYTNANGAPCVTVAIRASSPEGLADLRTAFTTWAPRHEGAEVTVEGETLVVSRCIAGSRGRNPA